MDGSYNDELQIISLSDDTRKVGTERDPKLKFKYLNSYGALWGIDCGRYCCGNGSFWANIRRDCRRIDSGNEKLLNNGTQMSWHWSGLRQGL